MNQQPKPFRGLTLRAGIFEKISALQVEWRKADGSNPSINDIVERLITEQAIDAERARIRAAQTEETP